MPPRVRGRAETDFLSVEKNSAGIGNHRARQNLAERRFARAIVADQAENLSGAQLEMDMVERPDDTVGLADVLHPHPDGAPVVQHGWPLGEKEPESAVLQRRLRPTPLSPVRHARRRT